NGGAGLRLLRFFLCFCAVAVTAEACGQVLTPDTLAPRESSVFVAYDRIHRNPGSLQVSTINVGAAVGITGRLEFSTVLEANRRVVVRRPEQLSFGQQALGFFGDKTPGSPPLPEERVAGSSSMAQLRSPPTPDGTLTGAAGYYNLLPFAGLVR